MASETYWVIKDGDYLCRHNGGWSWTIDPGDAHHFATLKDAYAELDECPVTARVVRRRSKRGRLILTGEAARLVRWLRSLKRPDALARRLCDEGFTNTSELLAALASEEVCDG